MTANKPPGLEAMVHIIHDRQERIEKEMSHIHKCAHTTKEDVGKLTTQVSTLVESAQSLVMNWQEFMSDYTRTKTQISLVRRNSRWLTFLIGMVLPIMFTFALLL